MLPNESTKINIIAYSPLSTSQIVPLLLTVQFNTPKGIISYSQNFSLVLTGFIKINVLNPNVIYDNGSLVFEATLLNTGNTRLTILFYTIQGVILPVGIYLKIFYFYVIVFGIFNDFTVYVRNY